MKPRIGLIGVTAQLYHEKYPELVMSLGKFGDRTGKLLARFADVLVSPVVYTRRQMEESCGKLARNGVDGLILVFLSYSPSRILSPVLKEHPELPLLIWNTQELRTIGKEFAHGDLFRNHGMHGVQDLTNVLLRENVRFSLITGHGSDPRTLSAVQAWCNAAAVAAGLRKSRIARIGGRFRDMGDFAVPDERITRFLGPGIVDVSLEEVAAAAREVSPAMVKKTVAADRKAYRLDASLDADVHRTCARMEWALRDIVDRRRLDGLAANFMAFRGGKGCEVIPFPALSKFLEEGLGYGGEGDVLCATSVLILQRLRGMGNFVEMFVTDYGRDRIFMCHMGESNPAMAADPRAIRLVKKDMAIVEGGLAGAILLFALRPGKVSLFNIAPTADRFRFICAGGEIEDRPLMKGVISPHFFLRVKERVEDFLSGYSRLGGTHHLAMTYGDCRQELGFLGEILDIPVCDVESDTIVSRGCRRES